MENWELIKQSKENWELIKTKMKIKNKMLSKLINEKYGHDLGEFNNTTGTEGLTSNLLLLYFYYSGR